MVAGNHERISFGDRPGLENPEPFPSAAANVNAQDEMSRDHKPEGDIESLCLEVLDREAGYYGGRVMDDNDDERTSLSEEQRRSHARKASEHLHGLYKAGLPFFTKTAIQNIVHQFDQARHPVCRTKKPAEKNTEVFIFSGLDGKPVKFRMENEETVEVRNGKTESINKDPMLRYQCYQHLTVEHAYRWNQGLDYCPLRILYRVYIRDRISKVTIPVEDLQKRRSKEGWPPAVDKVRTDFHACLTDWEEAEELRQRLESALRTIEVPAVTKIVAFACATISDDGRPATRAQHVLMLALKDIVEARQRQRHGMRQELAAGFRQAPEAAAADSEPCNAAPPPIQCFAQDPSYIETDKLVLAEHGVTVLDDPRGFLQVDDQSVVLSFAPNICVRQIVTDIARPALLIWDRVLDEDESMKIWAARFGESRKFESLHEVEGSLTDPESPRVRDMIRKEYTEVLRLDDDLLGTDTCVYVRKV